MVKDGCWTTVLIFTTVFSATGLAQSPVTKVVTKDSLSSPSKKELKTSKNKGPAPMWNWTALGDSANQPIPFHPPLVLQKKPNRSDGPRKSSWGDVQRQMRAFGQKLMLRFFTFENAQAQAPPLHTNEERAGSIVNWFSRLIGVDGKSLGEFLREYQVHVLYDLVFTFIKWIFFLYAGLLIP